MMMAVDMRVVDQNEVFYSTMVVVDYNKDYYYYYFVDKDVYYYHWQNSDFLKKNRNEMNSTPMIENYHYVDEMMLVDGNYSVDRIDSEDYY